MHARKTKLLKSGLILLPVAFVANIFFVQLNIHGILRELSRAGILVGFFLIIFGGIYNLFKRKI